MSDAGKNYMVGSGNYDDLIDLPRPVSKRHAPLSKLQRAAQFAPFAALTGLDEKMDAAKNRNEERYFRELQSDDEIDWNVGDQD